MRWLITKGVVIYVLRHFSLNACICIPPEQLLYVSSFHLPYPSISSIPIPMYTVQFVGHVIQEEFTEYHMKVVDTASGSSWLVRRRYREFRDLHDQLKLKYPSELPSIPGKKMWGNQDPEFVRQRQDQLQTYMLGVLHLEPDCRTRVLQKFLEIKKSAPETVSEVVSRTVSSQPSVSTATTPPLVRAQKQQELGQILSQLEKNIFDLSVAPTLLDPTEYAARKTKYLGIMNHWEKCRDNDQNHLPPATLSSVAELQAIVDSALGKLPLVRDSDDLVAFFPTATSE